MELHERPRVGDPAPGARDRRREAPPVRLPDDDALAGAIFGALSDPTRRAIVRALAEEGSGTASTLAAGLPISRQAVAKHLAALRDAGLAEAQAVGRETRYRLTPAPFAAALAWLTATDARIAGRDGRDGARR